MLSLRQDLDLTESAKSEEGGRIWLLQDTINNKYFKLGFDEVKFLAKLRSLKLDFQELDETIGQLKAGLGSSWTAERIKEFLLFLKQNNLLTANGLEARAVLIRQRQHLQPTLFKKLLRSYLFMKFHILNPNSLLDKLLPSVSWLFLPVFWLMIGLNTVVAVYLTSRQFDYFASSFIGYFNTQGLIIAGLAIAFAKILHEFGHAIVARRFGCAVNSMGFALLIFWPVLFTDTTDSWKLRNPRQRALIGAAGVLTELVLASVCLTLWNFVDEGNLKSALFILATTTWILTLAINLNPLMRFDGYFVLSDLLGVENLQGRSFAMATWKLREWLFGYQFEPPEKPKMGLILFAYATWIYRFLLYLGIALIIYNYFFKLLGIFLVTIQLFNSLVKPLYKELKFWWANRERAKLFPNTSLSFILLAALCLWLLIPSRQTLSLPAFWHSADTRVFYAQQAGGMLETLASDGAMVRKGEVIARLRYPDTQFQADQQRRDLELIEAQLAGSGIASGFSSSRATLIAQLQAARKRMQELESVLADQIIVAPFDGKVRSVNRDLSPNQWISVGERLLTLVDPTKQEVVAYVSEQDYRDLEPGQAGTYYSDGGQLKPQEVELISIDSYPVDDLDELYTASTYGGGLSVRDSTDGQFTPQIPTYRLRFDPGASIPDRISRGSVSIKSAASSPLGRYIRNGLNVWRRESGF
ncbi:MAG: HlyD family efflux transporter periplasmic adaptor subunit [Pseudohongiellaceae bacterium]